MTQAFEAWIFVGGGGGGGRVGVMDIFSGFVELSFPPPVSATMLVPDMPLLINISVYRTIRI